MHKLFWVGVLIAARLTAADTAVIYQNDLEKCTSGSVPDDMLVLDGAFEVKEEAGNKVIELPGAPLETYGVLFGPSEPFGIAVEARVFGIGKGRRFPTFGVGLNGVGGFQLRVAPAKKSIELLRNDEPVATAPFAWESGSWTVLRLESAKASDGPVQVRGKAWKQGDPEPATWQIEHKPTAEAPSGRPSIWGSPYAGTPIRFDDLKVTKAVGLN
jgi:hypothetical protein